MLSNWFIEHWVFVCHFLWGKLHCKRCRLYNVTHVLASGLFQEKKTDSAYQESSFSYLFVFSEKRVWWAACYCRDIYVSPWDTGAGYFDDFDGTDYQRFFRVSEG